MGDWNPYADHGVSQNHRAGVLSFSMVNSRGESGMPMLGSVAIHFQSSCVELSSSENPISQLRLHRPQFMLPSSPGFVDAAHFSTQIGYTIFDGVILLTCYKVTLCQV